VPFYTGSADLADDSLCTLGAQDIIERAVLHHPFRCIWHDRSAEIIAPRQFEGSSGARKMVARID
jgi:hypothetical protein